MEHVLGFVFALATVMLLCFDMVAGTRVVECPRGFYANGVKYHGRTECVEPYGCVDRVNVRGGWTSTCEGDYVIGRHVWCDANERAVVDLRGIVRCQNVTPDR